jgi:hypothetical protein
LIGVFALMILGEPKPSGRCGGEFMILATWALPRGAGQVESQVRFDEGMVRDELPGLVVHPIDVAL